MPPDPPSRHTCLHVREHAFARYYHPATTMFSLSHLKILYETLVTSLALAEPQMWQSRVEIVPFYISIITYSSAELSLRVGLIRTA